MRLVVGLLLCGACGFAPSGAAIGSDARDATTAIDAPVIGPMCHVGVASTGDDAGRIGGSGGGTLQPVLACPSQQTMVGVSLLVSDGTAGGPNERSAQGIQFDCAPVTIAANPFVGVSTTIMVMGNGGAGWAPSQWTPHTTCPAGAVIAGFTVHSGQNDSAFIDASITCAAMDVAAHTTTRTDVYVAGSLSEPLNPFVVPCPAGEIAASFAPHTGAGLDSLELSCARPTCN